MGLNINNHNKYFYQTQFVFTYLTPLRVAAQWGIKNNTRQSALDSSLYMEILKVMSAYKKKIKPPVHRSQDHKITQSIHHSPPYH